MTRWVAVCLLLCASVLVACDSKPTPQNVAPNIERTTDTNQQQTNCMAALDPTACRRRSEITGNYPLGSVSKGEGGSGGIGQK